MTVNEYMTIAAEKTKQLMLDIDKALQDGDEKTAAYLITYRMGNKAAGNFGVCQQEAIKIFYKRFVNPAILYRLIIDVYTNDGYDFPKQVMLKAKRLSKAIPEADRLAGLGPGDELTIYRATVADVDKARKEFSWTTSLEVAKHFATFTTPPRHIYKGLIRRGDIIAYTNEREEHEVIQHNDVCITSKESD